jgi:hypothetical protein
MRGAADVVVGAGDDARDHQGTGSDGAHGSQSDTTRDPTGHRPGSFRIGGAMRSTMGSVRVWFYFARFATIHPSWVGP